VGIRSCSEVGSCRLAILSALKHGATDQLVHRSMASKCHLPRNTSFTEAIQIVTSADRSTYSSTDCEIAPVIFPLNFLHVHTYIYIYLFTVIWLWQ